MKNSLDRFLIAQKSSYDQAYAEIKAGKKTSHWMWYVFPQIQGLGHSQMSVFYAIADIREARDYLAHPILGIRLREICQSLLQLDIDDAFAIFGNPDDQKLRSCMTLFAYADGSENNLFEQVLQKFFEENPDLKTLRILGAI